MNTEEKIQILETIAIKKKSNTASLFASAARVVYKKSRKTKEIVLDCELKDINKQIWCNIDYSG